VLVLSGGIDPVTPPALGEIAMAGFGPGVHAVAPEGDIGGFAALARLSGSRRLGELKRVEELLASVVGD
jgi:hypothetical protein